ncbi:hypothetical protein ABWJ92_32460 [Streptomyces sp. NPDC000609]|uniref:hypothetical protein n=1 Tax=Streptomyces sp. NPDC000609 TaxID=3160957 RepID=UPI00339A414A
MVQVAGSHGVAWQVLITRSVSVGRGEVDRIADDLVPGVDAHLGGTAEGEWGVGAGAIADPVVGSAPGARDGERIPAVQIAQPHP